jgi:hypothetical protein
VNRSRTSYREPPAPRKLSYKRNSFATNRVKAGCLRIFRCRSSMRCCPLPLLRASVMCGWNGLSSGTNPQCPVAATTRSCRAINAGVGRTPAMKTPARSKKPSPSSTIGTGAARSACKRGITHAQCSWFVVPRNCSVTCQDSAEVHRSPSPPDDCSRARIRESSSTTVSASGIAMNNRIPRQSRSCTLFPS